MLLEERIAKERQEFSLYYQSIGASGDCSQEHPSVININQVIQIDKMELYSKKFGIKKHAPMPTIREVYCFDDSYPGYYELESVTYGEDGTMFIDGIEVPPLFDWDMEDLVELDARIVVSTFKSQ